MIDPDSQFLRMCKIVPYQILRTSPADDESEDDMPVSDSQPALSVALQAIAANDELRRAFVDMQATAARWCSETRREHKRFRLAFGMCFALAVLAVVGWVLWIGGYPAGSNLNVSTEDLLAIREGWHPSMFMPRWVSRITLEVTDTRVQRVQEISEEDAIAEGIREVPGKRRVFDGGGMAMGPNARQAYMRLWDSINGKKHPWANNNWVWSISFRRLS